MPTTPVFWLHCYAAMPRIGMEWWDALGKEALLPSKQAPFAGKDL